MKNGIGHSTTCREHSDSNERDELGWARPLYTESNQDEPKSNCQCLINDCRYCDRDHTKHKRPAFGQIRRKCGGKNHFAVKYQAKSSGNVVQAEDRFYLSMTTTGETQARESVTLATL